MGKISVCGLLIWDESEPVFTGVRILRKRDANGSLLFCL